ncbi:MAG: elongation factor P [Candidatus Neomarinimicrobiota bacterium]
MATTADIKNGVVILHKEKRMKVIEFQHVKPGKGGAFVRTKLKDLLTGKIMDHTFNAGARMQYIRIEARKMQFLYDDGDSFHFMDNDTYEQIAVNGTIVLESKNFMIAGMNVELLFDGDEVLDVRIPLHVNLKVVATEPGFKGNTATGATKPATIETGYTLQVPLFIDNEDILRIDTRSGEYIERAKS